MRQVREVLRLKHVAGHSERSIAAAIGISRYTVAEYLRRATVVGITWPVPAELDDSALEARLFSPPFAVHESPRPQPDWPRLHAELRRPGVTLLLLWEGYRAGQPDGYGYSRFCHLYRDLARRHLANNAPDPCRRRTAVRRLRRSDRADDRSTHRRSAAGTDLRCGTRRIELRVRRSTLVAGPGGLDRLSRQCPDLLRPRHAPDRLRQLRAGVTAACRYEPGINRTYQEMARTTAPPFTPLAVRSATPAGFVGITGWLPSEQVAGFNRNRWLFSSESASKAL